MGRGGGVRAPLPLRRPLSRSLGGAVTSRRRSEPVPQRSRRAAPSWLFSRLGDVSLIPGLERSPGEGNGEPLQDSCLGNPMDRGAWWTTVHGVTKSRTRLSD
ncbi:unnamed protein product [Rangifer tarandus platyrhynchus]|uniref:Uncharacterized protein n=2 Tax=Rangifer tarandus platyrhynchus TaxID=3082113 RepID=A0AC60A555_RANTA|nr:unnamed protein product [Rangifer tarandus platyrhynchus]